MTQSYSPLPDGFYPKLVAVTEAAPWEILPEYGEAEVRAALAAESTSLADLLALLSPAAEPFLEALARKAQAATLRHFGRAVQFFTPLYLSNLCSNRCLYCGFNARMRIARSRLSLKEVEKEAAAIAATGLRRVLALTGDVPKKTGADYLAACVAVLARHFPSVGIEVPSMSMEEYGQIAAAGAESLTLYQETYNEALYARLHLEGPKRDFAYRLDAPQRAAEGGMRGVNLGPLLGLDDWRRDVFLCAMHADFLLRRYPGLEISVSLPRLRAIGEAPDSPEEQAFHAIEVGDRHFVQALAALRCFLPQAGITLSTRETAALRDKLIPICVTRVSAGVSTAVGGHAIRLAEKNGKENAPQFEISDPRSVDEMSQAVSAMGYQPVFTDWLIPGDAAGSITPIRATPLAEARP